jgi:uncharacterized Ntn-hydrolase superfamily protein
MSKKGNSVLQDILNIGLNVSTGGLVGFEADNGGVGAGVTGEVAIDGIKEVTGVNAAEEANKLQREQFETEQENIAKDREDALAQKAADALKSSNLAGGNRRNRGKNSSNTSANTSSTGASGKDFLGL